MAYTNSEIIAISKICQYLAADSESQGMLLRSGYERKGLSRLIYIIRSGVEWLLSYNPSSDLLLGQANFLFSLCQPFVGRALQIQGSGGSGTIVNPATGVVSTIQEVYLQFIVGVTASPQVVNGVNVTLPTNGSSSMVLPLESIINQSITVTKDNVPLPIGLSDRESFTPIYTSTDVTINVNDNFSTGDLFVIQGLQFVAL